MKERIENDFQYLGLSTQNSHKNPKVWSYLHITTIDNR